MADPFEKLSKPADPFAKLAAPATTDPFSKLSKPAPDAIQKEIAERGFLDRPFLVPQEVTDEELKQIAGKYGTSAEDLRSALPFLGGMPQDVKASDVLKGTAGFAGESVGFGVPQKLFRMAQDPKQEAALDELKDLVSGRKSALQMGAELLVPGVGLAKAAKLAGGGIKGAATAGTLAGAAGGFGYSKAGEELSGAVIGGALGAGIGAAGQKLANKLSSKGQKALTETEQTAIKNLEPQLEQLEQEAVKALDSKPGNALMQDYVTGIKAIEDIPTEDANRIVAAELSPDMIKKYISLDNPEGLQLSKRLDPKAVSELGQTRASISQLAGDIISQQRASYLEQVTGKKISDPELLQEAWNKEMRQGLEYVATEFRNFRVGQKMSELIENKGLHDLNPESKVGQIVSKLSDARFALRTVDEKFGTSLESVLDTLSRNRNLMGAVREADKKVLDSVYELASKNGSIAAAKSGKIFTAIDKGAIESLSPAEKETAQEVIKEFDRLYNFVTSGIQEKGIKALDIPRAENYVARMSLPVPETIAKVEMELRNAVDQANKILNTNYTDIAQLSATDLIESQNLPAFRNLQRYLNWVKDAEIELKNGADLSKLINESIRSEKDIRMLDKVARGSMERTAEKGGIPDFIREKNIFKVLDRYSQDMLSTLYQREPLSRMKFIADRLDSLGAKNEAQYVRNIVEDTWGVRKGTVAHYMRDARSQIARTMDPRIDDAVKKGQTTRAFVLNSVKEMEELPGFLAKQIYPNVLGWRPVPILQNVFSGIARTAPELGTKYGYTTYVRGLVYALQNWATLNAEVKAVGLIPESFSRSGQRAISDGLRASGVVDTGLRGLDALGRLGMSLYEKSEQLNRISILGTAKMMAHDLTKNNSLAQEALTKFPSAIQRAVRKVSGDEKEVASILATYLNGATAFNYNRPSLYEFGRTMGPMFATFAKWPTSIAGETISEIRTKGLPRGLARSAERYAAPLMAFAAIDYMLQDKLEESERLQKIVGKTGLKKAAPVSSLGGFVAGDIFTPPMIDTVMQDIVIPATKAEGVKLVRGLDRAAFTYLPGAGFIKFLTEDIPTYITGERPEGGTQTERSLQSLGVTE